MFWWIVQNFVVAGLLAAFVEVGCRAARIGPVGRHVLWLLVLLKLVAPPVILQWPWEVPAPLQLTSRLLQQTNMPGPIVTGESAVDAAPAISDSSTIPGSPATSMAASAAESRSDGSRRSGAFRSSIAAALRSALPYLRRVWLIGGIVFLLIQCLRMGLIVRIVQVGRPAGPVLSEQVDTLARHLRIRSVRTRVVPGIKSPLIWSGNLLHPQLLWPAGLPTDFSADWQRGLIVHELAHVKRRDHWVGWIRARRWVSVVVEPAVLVCANADPRERRALVRRVGRHRAPRFTSRVCRCPPRGVRRHACGARRVPRPGGGDRQPSVS